MFKISRLGVLKSATCSGCNYFLRYLEFGTFLKQGFSCKQAPPSFVGQIKRLSTSNKDLGSPHNTNGGKKDKILVNLTPRKKPEALNLFLVHGVEGLSEPLIPLASKLSCNLYAFQSTKRYGRAVEVPKFMDIVEEYVNEIKLVQPEGPYNIGGYSLGGNFSIEMGIKLESGDNKPNPVRLIILDSTCSFGYANRMGTAVAFDEFFNVVKHIFKFSEKDKKAYSKKLHPTDLHKNRKMFLDLINAKVKRFPSDDPEVLKLLKICETLITLSISANDHMPEGKFGGNVDMIKAKDTPWSDASNSLFQQFCEKPITYTLVSGEHQSFLEMEKVQETANIINRLLNG